MNQNKTYSHFRLYSIQKSKHKSPLKSRDMSVSRKRSVTYKCDIDLIKSISCQENLLDLISKVQKQKQEYLQSLYSSQSTNLPVIQIELDENKNSKHNRKKKLNDSFEHQNGYDSSQRYIRNKQNNCCQLLQPTQYKKIDYQGIKTFESAISIQQQNELYLNQINIQSNTDLIRPQQTENIISKAEDDYNQFNKLLVENYNQDFDLYKEQSKMNKIINDALKIKQQKRDPINASKSLKQKKAQMNSYLKNQYQTALSQVMEGVNTSPDDRIKFKRKQYQKVLKKSNSFQKIAQQYTKKALRSQTIEPNRQEFLTKALDIYNKCYTYLN